MRPTSALGRLFAAGFAAVKAVRPDRPIHPQGVLLSGALEVAGGPASGIALLDSPGITPVTARLSRSAGFPPGWPDVIGLALRLDTDDGAADLLLASTGWRVPGRFALTMHRTAGAARLTSLMPYRGSNGPVLLGARTAGTDPGAPGRFRPDARWDLELLWAAPRGSWQRCGTLRLAPVLDAGGRVQDTPLRFDPLLNVLPGAGTYAWTRALREHSYRLARR
ncbi:hypothetical protein [Sinomonas halotolerans]|uniref:Phosphodiesterase n=1 Tax=Sinomonas halotolerans TaxID=1644133 RepID=A0ABU9X0K9_9MICC